MKELGITKEQAKSKLIDTIGHYNLKANNVSKFKFNEKETELFANMMVEFANETNNELLERYNEAIEVLENVKRLETLIRYPDDVSIMHEGEAKAIHMMLNRVEQTISKANGK